MEQYIPKSALVAEIERLDNYWHLSKSASGQAFVENLFSFLDTLEMKEVDLDKEIDNTYRNYVAFGRQEIAAVAKHFFELGMIVSNKAKKGE